MNARIPPSALTARSAVFIPLPQTTPAPAAPYITSRATTNTTTHDTHIIV